MSNKRIDNHIKGSKPKNLAENLFRESRHPCSSITRTASEELLDTNKIGNVPIIIGETISGKYGNKDIPPRDNAISCTPYLPIRGKLVNHFSGAYVEEPSIIPGFIEPIIRQYKLHSISKMIRDAREEYFDGSEYHGNIVDILYTYKDLSFLRKRRKYRSIVIDSISCLFSGSHHYTESENIVMGESCAHIQKLCKHLFGGFGYNTIIKDSYGVYMRTSYNHIRRISRCYSYDLFTPPVYTMYDIFIKDNKLKACNTTQAEIKNLRSRYNPITMKHDYFIEMDSGITINNYYSDVIIAYEGVDKQEIKYEFNNYIRHDNILNYNKVSPYLNYVKRLMK